jgi:hypothetical protein
MPPINKREVPGTNRGVELLLKNRREEKTEKNKSKNFGFLKSISLLKREIQVQFYISILKKN